MGNTNLNTKISKFLEFKIFMDKQILEIENYKNEKLKEFPGYDENECVFEWIKNNAEFFRKRWLK